MKKDKEPDTLWNVCVRKEKYTEEEVKKEAEILRITWYHCPVCDFYHLAKGDRDDR